MGFFFFVLLQIALGSLAWYVWGWPAAAITLALLAWLAIAWQHWAGQRVLDWLRSGQAEGEPELSGQWGEAAARMRRRLREEHLQTLSSATRLQEILAALQASPNGITLLDEQGRIEWCNHIAQAHFGFEAERDTLQSLGNLLRAPEFAAYVAAQDFSHDVLLAGRNSRPEHPVRISAQIFPYGSGRKLLLSRDITALEQAEAMRRDFVANVSHEIRTPLTVLVGFVETLQTLDLSADERQHYLTLMAQQGTRMQNLVQDLLTLSRMEGSPPPSHDEWLSVASLLGQCEQEARALATQILPAGAAALQLFFPDAASLQAAGDVAGNSLELHSALSNLISNAVRYTPAGGQVRVSWQNLPDGSARFAVRDTGAGIAPEHLPRITERFYRADRSRSRETGGTGLGLAIVKHALQRHGAQLQVSSQLGQGSEFAVLFPAKRLRLQASPTNATATA